MTYNLDDCTLDDDIALGCIDYSVGGVQAVIYAVNREAIKGKVTLDADGAVTQITFNPNYPKFFRWEVAENSASATAPLQGGDNRGGASLNRNHTLVFTIQSLSQDIIKQLDKMARSKGVCFIVEPRIVNGATAPQIQENRHFLIGYPNGMLNTTSESGTGAAETDLAGSIQTFARAQPNHFMEIRPDPAIYTGPDPMNEFIQAMLENPA